jgi:outer membrane protein assembly factor BamB
VSFAGGLVYGTGQHSGQGIAVVDVDTGKLRWKSKENLKCTPSLALPNCLLSQRQGCASALDLSSLAEVDNPGSGTRVSFTGFRPSCSYPGLPANGMIYQQAEGCACASPIRGNIAFTPGQPVLLETAERLVKGDAFDRPVSADARHTWSTWRADHLRSARTDEPAPAALELLWSQKLAGRLTPMAAGQGLVLCGSSDHKVYALDAASGLLRWQRIGAGRVQAAPYLWRGRLYCTDDDGWAFCLRADSGAPIWQFRAALGQERIVGYGGFMSRWPARTGVLVHDDTAYFAAGLFPDEGTVAYAVDPLTGALRWQKRFDANNKGGRTAGFVPDGAMALAHDRLYIPSGAGMPWQIALNQPERPASFTTGYHVRGHQIMVAGKDLLAVTPDLQYVHHVHYKDTDPLLQLPIVTDDTLYLLNQPVGRDRQLVAADRAAYELSQNRASFYVPKKKLEQPLQKSWRWTAWQNEPMFALIATQGTIFSGGVNKVYATRVDDGKELWHATVPGNVIDLACNDGRLFVQCDSGTVLCFGPKR